MDEFDYFDMRRNSVEEHLPCLAYALSDIVILVTTGNLSKNSVYKQACKHTIDRALNGVENSEKPCLIVISNKSANPSTKSTQEVENVTAQYLKILDRRQRLKQYYLNVKVMELEVFSDRADLDFQAGIRTLQIVIQDVMVTRLERRKPTGLLVNSYSWINLLRFVLKEVNNNSAISVARTLNFADACALNTFDNTQRAYRFFQAAFSALPFPVSTKAYEGVKLLSAQILAIYIAEEVHVAAKELVWNVVGSELHTRERNQKARKCLEELLNLIALSEPCQAVDIVGMVHVPCTETRHSHLNSHFCSIPTSGLKRQQNAEVFGSGVMLKLAEKSGLFVQSLKSQVEWRI